MDAPSTCTQCEAPAPAGALLCAMCEAVGINLSAPTENATFEYEEIPGNRYEIVSRVGTGAFGSVYKAHDTMLDRPVAVKTIRLDTSVDPEQRKALNKRFVREAQVAAQLHHPNIMTVYDIMFTDETGFIVMEFIEGQTLQTHLKKKRVSVAQSVDIAKQVARALQYAHEHKIIHRDIKPANIMITPALEARITDFGIAKSDGATHLTMSGSLVGTPDYMSPEQARGEDVDARTDLFSLGCVFYECAVGEKPFTGGSLTGVLLSIVNTNPFESEAWASKNFPSDVRAVAERMLAKDVDARFASAQELVEALEALEIAEAEAPDTTSEEEAATTDADEPVEVSDETDSTERMGEEMLAALKEEDRPLKFSPSLSDDLQEMSLTPAQGYVLSRIDGASRARDILAVSPMPELEVAETLSDLIEKGLLTVEDSGSSSGTGAGDPAIELDAGLLQEVERILELGKRRRYSELLRVNVHSSTAEVKQNYLELMQRFHPDAQGSPLGEASRQLLSKVCGVATKALAAISGKGAEPFPKPERKAPDEAARKSYAEDLFKHAELAFETTDYWEAIQLTRQALELDPDNPRYHFLLGQGLMKNQNWMKEAEESLRKAAELDPSQPEYFGTLADLYKREGMPERAQSMKEKAKALDPNYAGVNG